MAEGAGDGPLRYYKSSEAIVYFSFCCTAPGRAVCMCMRGAGEIIKMIHIPWSQTIVCLSTSFFDALISQIYRQTADLFPQKFFH